MKYVFEDCQFDPLCQLFNCMYPKEVSDNFIYTRGNGKLERAVQSLVGEEDRVYVYLDLVPGNLDSVRIYKKLWDYKDEFERYLIFPIICREYYYLLALYNTCAVVREDWVHSCLSRQWYLDGSNSIIETDMDKRFCSSFEKLCKLTIKKALRECAKGKVLEFYAERCSDYIIKECYPYCPPLEDKMRNILSAFDCVPSGSIATGKRAVSFEEAIQIHRKLVDCYNDMCSRFKAIDTRSGVKYLSIKYMA